MKKYQVLAKVYWSTSMTTAVVVLAMCLVFNWNYTMLVGALTTCLVLSAPAVIILNALHFLAKKIEVTMAFTWMILLSSVPLLLTIPAVMFADQLPGDVIFLVFLGMICSYAGLLGHGLSISQLFKSQTNG